MTIKIATDETFDEIIKKGFSIIQATEVGG